MKKRIIAGVGAVMLLGGSVAGINSVFASQKQTNAVTAAAAPAAGIMKNKPNNRDNINHKSASFTRCSRIALSWKNSSSRSATSVLIY